MIKDYNEVPVSMVHTEKISKVILPCKLSMQLLGRDMMIRAGEQVAEWEVGQVSSAGQVAVTAGATFSIPAPSQSLRGCRSAAAW